jgi:hypothetical protein
MQIRDGAPPSRRPICTPRNTEPYTTSARGESPREIVVFISSGVEVLLCAIRKRFERQHFSKFFLLFVG